MKLLRSFSVPVLILILAVSACSSNANASDPVPVVDGTEPSQPTSTTVASITPDPTKTPVPTLTSTPTSTPAPILVQVGPGPIKCPILLYHRIMPGQGENPYNLTPNDFEGQMRYLFENGYATITIDQLRDAILFGAMLPEKPVVISFDDGDVSVYKNAYPIMEKYGFTGVTYLVTTYLETPGYMKTRMVKDLIRSGWEIGSHSSRHQDVSKTTSLDTEVVGSKADLEKMFNIEVRTFAYPFGGYNPSSMQKVSEWYSNAVGLGASTVQKESNLYYLWRRPVDNGTTLEQFIGFLK